MSQRLIIAIGISGFVGVVLLILLNVVTAFQSSPTSTPRVAIGPTPSTTAFASVSPTATPTAPTATVSPTPTASGSAEPSSEPGSSLSAGTLSLRIAPPVGVELSVAASCHWAADQPLRVADVASVDGAPLDVRGEHLRVLIGADDPGAALELQRLGTNGLERASYAKTRATRDAVTVTAPGDHVAGRAVFHGLGTNESTFPVGLLPLKRALFGQPLGNTADADQISGTVEWTCQPAPAGYQPGPPAPTPGPASADPFPTISLSGAGRSKAGVATCAQGTTATGELVEPDCGFSWPAPDTYDGTLVVPRNARMLLTAESGWRIEGWTVRFTALADVEVTLGSPRTNRLLFSGSRKPGVPSLFFRAPGKGTWIIQADVRTDGPTQSTARGTWYFLIRTT